MLGTAVSSTGSSTTSVPLWVPIAALLLGAAVPLLVELIQTRRSAADRRAQSADRRAEFQAEAGDRRDERREIRREQHRARQIDTLVELQQLASDYMRKVGEAYFFDQRAWREANRPDQFPVSLMPEGLSEELNTMQRRLQILRERVDDEAMWGLVDELIGASVATSTPVPPRHAVAEAAMARTGDAFQLLNRRVRRSHADAVLG